MSKCVQKHDFLIIGSGIAGLSLALKLANLGRVAILTKANAEESNTTYAQGGIAAVTYRPDTFEYHFNDTIMAGDYLNDKQIVQKVVRQAPKAIQNLVNLGVFFNKTDKGDFELSREGGHSQPRILHHKDVTGLEIERTLLKQIEKLPSITILQHHFALDLISVQENPKTLKCIGCYSLNLLNQKVETFVAARTVLASGGLSSIYSQTTNPRIATGDGVAMAYRIGAKIRNLEFIQFHPTSLYFPPESPNFLISETLRGAGAILRRTDGYAFMHLFDARKELAPRDIVARAIEQEIKGSGRECVYLDATKLSPNTIKNVFPNIYSHCLKIGIDICKDMIPVIPAAHYSCGGILVDGNGETTIKNLYASGECASTGLHGANRLGSNSLLEGLIFSDLIYKHIQKHRSNAPVLDKILTPSWGKIEVSKVDHDLINSIYVKMRKIMFEYVGLTRSNAKLEYAKNNIGVLLNEVNTLYKKYSLSVNLCELRNSLQVCSLIIKSAMLRLESRGVHFNVDYPNKIKESNDTILG